MARVVLQTLGSPTAASSSSAQATAAASLPPIYNENGVELEQPLTIHPLTGKPKIKRQFARRYASLILAHVARENAANATREALEYRAKKKAQLELLERQSRKGEGANRGDSGGGGCQASNTGRRGLLSLRSFVCVVYAECPPFLL